MTDADLNALVAQPGDIGILRSVRTLHRIAEIAQHLGDAAHADAADSDEVNRPDFARQSHAEVLVMPLLIALF